MTIERIQLWRSWGRHAVVVVLLVEGIVGATMDLLDSDHMSVMFARTGGSALYLTWLLVAAPVLALIGTYTKDEIAGALLELIGWCGLTVIFVLIMAARIAADDRWWAVGTGVGWDAALTVGSIGRTIQLAILLAYWTPIGRRLLERALR